MLPVALDLADWPVILVGAGRAAELRLALLDDAGATDVTVFVPDPTPALRVAAGTRLRERLPNTDEIAAARLLLLAGLDAAAAVPLAEAARRHRVLVNTEDDTVHCDFHMPAMVRRGALLLSISTGGASPALARRIRLWLAERFGPEWVVRLDEAAELRRRLRAEGASPAQVAAAIEALCEKRGWLA
jgi:precorrin-2 dehydrogenase/sirohydrochlorin ferrochelatase